MKKRPLCMICLVFLLIKTFLLIVTSGDDLIPIPASSIFCEMQAGEEARQVRIQGRIYKKEYTSKHQVLYLKQNLISYQEQSYKESKIIIYDDKFCACAIGETILLSGNLQKFEGARNPGNFDRQLYYARQGLYGCVYRANILKTDGEESRFQEFLCELRHSWKAFLCNHMSQEQGPVLATMLLNEKADMGEEMRELYQKNGISHVLAISGLHISFIGLGIYQLLRRLKMGYGVAGCMAVAVLTSYVVMIGFSVSIMRAYVMLLFRVAADVTGRVYDILTALAVSASMQIAIEPLYLTDAAFFLSYGAILAIVLVLPHIKALGAGLVISLFQFPLILFFYFEIPLTSLVLNLLVIPLTSLVLDLGIFGSLLGLLWKPAGGILLLCCDWILQGICWLAEQGLSLSFLRLSLGKPDVWKIIVYYVLFAAMLWWVTHRKRRAPVILAFAVLVLCLFVTFPNGKLRVAMLDVGQGDCTFLRGPSGKTYLIDGGSSDVDQVGKYRIEPFLKSEGVGKLDYVFLSHGDADHCNGVLELLARQKVGVRIDTLVLPVNYRTSRELLEAARLAQRQGVAVVTMKAEACMMEGDMTICCLQPADNRFEGNAGSMVLKVQFRSFDLLLTGDVEGEGEAHLLSQSEPVACDVLKVAHHGSRNSTSRDFLQVARPRVALISAGGDNAYGHPHQETLQRLQEASCTILETSRYGAIQLETDGEFIDIFPSSI